MFDLPRHKLIRRSVPIFNPNESVLDVCVEPWGDVFELPAKHSMELIFAGPRFGQPQITPYPDQLSIYGWEGSNFVAIHDNQTMGYQPTVDEIVLQEIRAATEQVRLTKNKLAIESMNWIQQALDRERVLSFEVQRHACELASHLALYLAPSFENSKRATSLLWHIIDRVVRTKAVMLGAVTSDHRQLVWGEGPSPLTEVLIGNAIFLFSRRATSTHGERLAKPPTFGAGFGRTSQ